MILAMSLWAAPTLMADEPMNDLIKTKEGFVFPSSAIKTYYSGTITWGDGYDDHKASNPVKGIAVVVWSNTDNWKFITTTNSLGEFKVQVEPNSSFQIKASDGDHWHKYKTIVAGIPVGTVGK